MAATVGQILGICDEIAPRELCEAWDNVGLLAGRSDWPVERALVALDLTHGALDEAEQMDAQLIVTHHPILFHARKNLREDDPEGALLCRLVRSRKALIAMHTNFDNASVGVGDSLAQALELKDVRALPHGLRVGAYGGCDLAAKVEEALDTRARIYGDASRVKTVAVCGGAGSEFWDIAKAAGADAYVTGEVRHHDALSAVASGVTLIEAGHWQTERISVKALRNGLQTRINALQYYVMVFESAFHPFAQG